MIQILWWIWCFKCTKLFNNLLQVKNRQLPPQEIDIETVKVEEDTIEMNMMKINHAVSSLSVMTLMLNNILKILRMIRLVGKVVSHLIKKNQLKRLKRMMKSTIRTTYSPPLAKEKLPKWIMKKILKMCKTSDTLPQRKKEIVKSAQNLLKMSQAIKFVWTTLWLLHSAIMKLEVLVLSHK